MHRAHPTNKIINIINNLTNRSAILMTLHRSMKNVWRKQIKKINKDKLTKNVNYNLQLWLNKKYANKQIVISDIIKLPTIRYLVFKNWSGNHLEYEVKDSQYKFKFTNGMVGLVKHLLEENGFVQTSNNDASIIWNIGVVTPSVYQSLGAYTKINHFPKTY